MFRLWKSVSRRAAAAMAFIALGASCSLECLVVHTIVLAAPERPPVWRDARVLAYQVSWRDEEGSPRQALLAEGEEIALRLRRGAPQAILATPLWDDAPLLPAGALYPHDLATLPGDFPSSTPDRMALSFASGYAAAVAAVIEAKGVDPWGYPIEKLAAAPIGAGKGPLGPAAVEGCRRDSRRRISRRRISLGAGILRPAGGRAVASRKPFLRRRGRGRKPIGDARRWPSLFLRRGPNAGGSGRGGEGPAFRRRVSADDGRERRFYGSIRRSLAMSAVVPAPLRLIQASMPLRMSRGARGSAKSAVPTWIATAPARRYSMASSAEAMPPTPMTGIFTRARDFPRAGYAHGAYRRSGEPARASGDEGRAAFGVDGHAHQGVDAGYGVGSPGFRRNGRFPRYR